MTKGLGGAQRKMRDTAIKQEKGFLGTYPRKLNPGDIQSMVFKSTDEGPFWMKRDEQEKTWYDQIVAGQTKTRTLRKAELKVLLEAKNIPAKGTAKKNKTIDYFKCKSLKRSYLLGASLHYLIPGGIRIS
jgi:hypothetical protein